MNKQTKALEMVIEYIDKLKSTGQTNWLEINVIQNACKEALEQPAQENEASSLREPVALERDYNFMRDLAIGCEDAWNELHNQEPVAWADLDMWLFDSPSHYYNGETPSDWTPLYTHPAPAWQGLSDDEIETIKTKAIVGAKGLDVDKLLHLIVNLSEQALRIKNES